MDFFKPVSSKLRTIAKAKFNQKLNDPMGNHFYNYLYNHKTFHLNEIQGYLTSLSHRMTSYRSGVDRIDLFPKYRLIALLDNALAYRYINYDKQSNVYTVNSQELKQLQKSLSNLATDDDLTNFENELLKLRQFSPIEMHHLMTQLNFNSPDIGLITQYYQILANPNFNNLGLNEDFKRYQLKYDDKLALNLIPRILKQSDTNQVPMVNTIGIRPNESILKTPFQPYF